MINSQWSIVIKALSQFSKFNIILTYKTVLMILPEELKVYQIAMKIGELIFNITGKWDLFNKKSLVD